MEWCSPFSKTTPYCQDVAASEFPAFPDVSDVSRFGIGYRLTCQILPKASRPALESFAKARHTHSLTRDVSAEGPSDLSFFWIKNTVQTGALMAYFDLALMPAFS